MSTAAETPFRWRSVALAALLPTVLFSIGEGAVIPVIPVVAGNVGATLAIAGFVSGMLVVGELIGDIPSGAVIARIGERTAMIAASGLSVLGLFTALLAPNPWVLALGILVVGIATAVFALARHAFMTSFVPQRYRARALSTLGGTFRFGYLVGPFLGAAIIQLTGSAASAFWIHVACCLAAAVVLIVLADPEKTFGATADRASAGRHETAGEREVGDEAHGLFRTIRAYRKVLLTLGLGSTMVAALRASRQVLLPLWAVSIGLHETQTSIIIGIAGAVDFSLFFAGGWIMDRFGRLWTAVPSMIGLGIGHLALAFTAFLPGPVWWFIGIAMFLSLANGIGAGILMTLGADLADPRHPAPFLGAWRFTNDAGGAAAPLIVSGLTALVSLPFAAGALGVLGLAGAIVLRVFVPRYSGRRGATPEPRSAPA
ncbi:MFS transporter [Lysinimonas soli]|uniref:MFS transporter n=1 Tax=Lysinimonas soli TaxID=1074233 RepID=A0ABW0NPH6_9MICO